MISGTHTSVFRVSYSDTDQMSFMHHSNYLKYYETARWELFRSLGIAYSDLEKKGFIFPVVNVSISYMKPALYDQEIRFVTSIGVIKGATINFENNAYNETGEIINKAKITVACVRKSTGKPCHLPRYLFQMLSDITATSVN